jgi:glycosyltransferase involved in cell wall biosynthesis
MRISFVTETFLPKTDGIVTRLCASIKWLSKQGHTIQVIAPDMGLKEYQNAQIAGMPAHKFWLYPDMPVALPSHRVGESLQAFKPDLVHVVNPALLGAAGVYYSRRRHLPLVASFHTNIPQYVDYYHLPFLKPILWQYFRTLHNHADLNLCTSETIKKELVQKKFRNVRVWQRGVASDEFGPHFYSDEMRHRLSGEHPGNTLLLYVGRLAAEKQIERLRPVLYASDNLSLAIVGDGPHRDYLEKYFGGTNTTFTGFLHGSNLAAAYASSDIFVFPSTTETLGLVILEAMASGLPVVAAESGPAREQIKEQVNGLLYQASHPESLTKAVLALENLELRKRLSQNAYAEGRQFGWERQSKQLFNFYQELAVPKYSNGLSSCS